MWRRFTENARKVVFYAQESAQDRGEPFVATEHILMGMLKATDCNGAKTLSALGLDQTNIEREVDQHAPAKSAPRPPGDMTLTPCAKKSIEFAIEETTLLNSPHIGSEHLLLGLLRQDQGVASHVLTNLGADLDKTRAVVAVLQDKDQKGKITN